MCPCVTDILLLLWTWSLVQAWPTNSQLQRLKAVSLRNAEKLKEDTLGMPLDPDELSTINLRWNAEYHPDNGTDPIEMADLFEGDIDILNIKFQSRSDGLIRNAIVDRWQTWPDGIIPYVISAEFKQKEREVIGSAISSFHVYSCVRFVPRTHQEDYVHILKGNACSSSVGRIGGEQSVSLASGCIYTGVVMHELMHVTGFWHEHSRYDRDHYVNIYWSNIRGGLEYNFQRYDWNRIQNLGVGYDLGSIMHYGPYAFARDRKRPTMLAKNGISIGQRRHFSQSDKKKMNLLYECDGSKPSSSTPKPISVAADILCKDSNRYCSTWAQKNECTTNLEYMKTYCKKSCKHCDKTCRDAHHSCAKWAAKEECHINSEYMNIYCQKSCKVCSAPPRPVDCIDKHRYCISWAKLGECEANSSYMHKYCKKSCKEC